MTYTTAVIKETLRRWPPAGTARMTKPGAGLRVQTSTGEYLLEGVSIYNCALMTHRDPKVYGDTADEFLPERWLDKTGSEIPASAWRPFERGPRNCIGQELATLEARIVIALVARRYDFTKVRGLDTTLNNPQNAYPSLVDSKIGIGELSLDETGKPVLDDKGHFKVISELYPVSFRADVLRKYIYALL
jgi:cytochrome P450